MVMEEGLRREPIFRDIRRYYCEYCGICRSKKSLIASHVLSHHQDEMTQGTSDGESESEGPKSNTCEECGASFRKPAYLRQHMLSHSLEYQAGGPPVKIHQVSLNHAWFRFERPFTCPVDDCHSSYRRKDHLTRHLLQHQGKLFECPVKNCSSRFSVKGNVSRHVKEIHDEESSSSGDDGTQKQCVCPEPGCGKVFKYPSRLQKHEASHGKLQLLLYRVKLDSVEAFCIEPGCLKSFSNEQCLRAHLQSCHQHITCEICGTKQLKKNIKRHLRIHEPVGSSDRIKCDFKGCLHTFSSRSNLQQHVKAVHLALRPFACTIPGCGMRFPFKHVRDNHEKSGCHVYTHGDFEESDELFRSRPRGGQKRKVPPIESLTRKRVVPPNESDSILRQGPEYLSWMLSTEADD
ncbi:hypothetical protein RHMOL_Rhmol06G0040600 [Rhododendron molle]|uniref:Uncharacterized protein n=1 Tax=Rhododendron molle TaxID=49168 RepID=A0ACC0NA08_RHOML|nr:hypothetical protein RHMOL_Rhmol06G0040600 [Rhododendron molle]